jgi:AraC-like DNA-binding protein
MLRESEKSITEIAYEAGFNSSQYFATVFKQFTDTDARSFRASRHPGLSRTRR